MTSTSAFRLHETMASNARKQLTLAVSLDEQNRRTEALQAYTEATALLKSYVQAFAMSATGFQKLSSDEQPIVTITRATLARHLGSAHNRIQVITNLKRNHNWTAPASAADPSASRSAAPGSATNPLRQAIESEILDNSPRVEWDDIYGLEEAKQALHEMVVLPAQRPDLYTGLRAPGRGVLLFGPPGTGKTMIAKAVASNADATFFSISASSLNSKFHGESERLVRTLFAVARERQPAFIFIDEVDSILGVRSDNEHEASRRLKTEFMSQFDGVNGAANRVCVMAASNRPQDLDDAVRRRLDRRIYIGLPNRNGRENFLKKVTEKNTEVKWALSASDLSELARRTECYSGSDIKALCREASLMPLRELGRRVSDVSVSDIRGCNISDFEDALEIVRPSSDAKTVRELEEWNDKYGSKPRQEAAMKRSPSSGGTNRSKATTKARLPWKPLGNSSSSRGMNLRPRSSRNTAKR